MPDLSKPRAIAVEAPDTIGTIVRTLLALVATATLLFLFTPKIIHAQDAPGSHKVEAGESLWSLAAKYYGDGLKWTELAKLNKLGDTGEKHLVVGQVITVPEGRVIVGKGLVNPPANTPRNALARALQPIKQTESASAPGALATQTADKKDAAPKIVTPPAPKLVASKGPTPPKAKPEAKPSTARAADSARAVATMAAPVTATADTRAVLNAETVAPSSTHIWGVDVATQRGARGKEGTTVFLKQTYDEAETETAVKAVLKVNNPRPRTGEYVSAPYTVEASRFIQGTTIGRRVGGAGSNQESDQLSLADEAELMGPFAGVTPKVGDRFVSVESGSLLKVGVRVAVPTGTLAVIRAEAGRPIIVRVVNQTGLIEEGQHVFVLEGAPTAAPSAAKNVLAGGQQTSVLWVESDALIPSTQSFVVLAAGAREGVKAGDEFALITKGADAQEQRVAVVRVVRVTPFGSSAIVIRQHLPLIAVGGLARLVAKAD